MDKECEILHNQFMETEKKLLEIRADRDYWKSEALKWCGKLGEIKLLVERSEL